MIPPWKHLQTFGFLIFWGESKGNIRKKKVKTILDSTLPSANFKPISGQCSHFIPSENTKKLKCYFYQKIIFCHIVALNAWYMNFLFEKKKSHSSDLDFYVLDESTNFKICDVMIDIRGYNFNCFFRILVCIKIKFDQVLVQLIANISNLFLSLLWRMETSSKPFWKFGKLTI